MSRGQANKVRIIGGQHKGRRLHFPAVKGLRPTTDRVRETLFNWLQPVIHGANCLDLFAGSGALGLEALSRGAAHTTFVDSSGVVVSRLKDNLLALGMLDRSQVLRADATRLVAREPLRTFDIVFLDPPFAAGLLEHVITGLEAGGWLSGDAVIYLEQDSSHAWPELPPNWKLFREGKAGQAAYRLLKRDTIRVSPQADDYQ